VAVRADELEPLEQPRHVRRIVEATLLAVLRQLDRALG
jgi:hypothetical protein